MVFSAKVLKTMFLTTVFIAASATAVLAKGTTIDVIGGKSDDPFFAKILRGVEGAGKVARIQGGSVHYLALQNYDNIGADAANLVRTAIGQHPNGIAVPDWVASSEDPAIEAAIAAHITVMIYNSGGMAEAKKLGALNYVGMDEYKAGLAGGEYFGAHGVKNVLCVNTVPGAQNLEARCKGISDGIAKAGGKSTELRLPSTSFGSPTAVAEAIKAALMQHPAVDGVMTISGGDADSAAIGISQAGDTAKIKLGAFDFDESALQRMKAGTQLFAIDLEPYMQGFLAAALLSAYVDYGLDVPTRPVLTGPLIVDSSNVDAALAGVKAGVR